MNQNLTKYFLKKNEIYESRIKQLIINSSESNQKNCEKNGNFINQLFINNFVMYRKKLIVKTKHVERMLFIK